MKIALQPLAISSYLRPKKGSMTALHDIKSALRKVARIGYDGIELATPAAFGSPEAYKDFLDEIGLEVPTCGGTNYTAMRESDFADKIRECHILGSRNVMVSNVDPVVLGNLDELNSFIAALNRAGRILKDAGIHLSFHNHAIDLARVGGVTQLQRIVEGTDPEAVYFELDTHWLTAGGAHVVSWIRALKGREWIIHFKDYAIDEYSDTTFLECTHKLFAEVGQGNIHWPGVLEACREAGIAWCAVEQDVCRRPRFESIAMSHDYLRGLGV